MHSVSGYSAWREYRQRRRVALTCLAFAALFLVGWQIGAWLLGVCCTGGAPAAVILAQCRAVPFLAFLAGAAVFRLLETLLWPEGAAPWPELLLTVAVAGAAGSLLWPH